LKLLLVGYHFAKTKSAGGHRLHSIVKYLSRMGWHTTVLTVAGNSEHAEELSENTFQRYVPGETEVISTRSLEMSWMWSWRKRGLTAAAARSLTRAGDTRKRLQGCKNRITNVLKPFARWVRAVVGFPDREVGWFWPLAVASVRVLKRRNIDVVMTSGPPHSSHLPFVLLRRLFPFVWVCDFRDPWTDPPFYAVNATSLEKQRVRFALNRLLEAAVLGSCDRVLANTTGNERALSAAFGGILGQKLTLLTNGFDEEIPVRCDGVDESALDCDFVFTGEVYPWMLDVYMDALAVLRADGHPLPVLHIFGAADAELQGKVHDRGLDRELVFKGSVSYEDSLWILARARSLLLLFIGHKDLFKCSVPSKLYAYLFSKRPYLALVPEGDAAQILEEVGGGRVVKSSDPREVARAIISFGQVMVGGGGGFTRNEDVLRRYSWSVLSRRLNDVLLHDVARRQKTVDASRGCRGHERRSS
jgi:hypothetical protein